MRDKPSGAKERIKGTAESKRVYQRDNVGMVRIRGGDQVSNLLRAGSISPQQADGGDQYRRDMEVFMSSGLQSSSVEMRVDGGKVGGGFPDHVIAATKNIARLEPLLTPDGVKVLHFMLIQDMNIAQITRELGVIRDVARYALIRALDEVAIYYGVMNPADRTGLAKKAKSA